MAAASWRPSAAPALPADAAPRLQLVPPRVRNKPRPAAAAAAGRTPPARRSVRLRSRPVQRAAAAAGDAAGSSGVPAGREEQGDGIQAEIVSIALPTLATLAADPLASLVSTAFIGWLGAAQLAGAGVALSLFNSSTKLLNVPLLAITTSTVAQALGAEQQRGADKQRGHEAVGAAASAALLLAAIVGCMQALVLSVLGSRGLAAWGAAPGSPLHSDAAAYLAARALAAPATVLMLVLQGCFRGLGDTRTPLLGTVAANVLNIALESLFLFGLGWGVRGAATAVGLSQAAACGVLLVLLRRRCPLRLVGGAALRRGLQQLGNTGLLALRTLGVMGSYAVATSLAARTDPAHAAAHQIAFQVWLASSLLADSLAVAAQTLLARSIAAGQQGVGRVVVRRTFQLAAWLGCLLAAGLAVGQRQIAALFTADPAVLSCLALVMPAVIATQPINALAFVSDGVLYGVGGFKYAAAAMVAACLPAAGVMLLAARWAAGLGGGAALDAQLMGVWAGLAVLMGMRLLTIYAPLVARRPPFDQLGA